MFRQYSIKPAYPFNMARINCFISQMHQIFDVSNARLSQHILLSYHLRYFDSVSQLFSIRNEGDLKLFQFVSFLWSWASVLDPLQ